MRKTAFQKWIVVLVVLAVIIPFGGAFSQTENTEVNNSIYLPLVTNQKPPVVLTDIWVGNASGYARSAYRPGDEVRFIIVGENPSDAQTNVDLQWDQVGPCGSTQIYSKTLTVESGLWVNSVAGTALDCLGTYTNTVQFAHNHLTSTLTTTFEVVNYSSEIVISDQQGFDKCGLPSVDDMQTWWVESPYSVFNIYLGGTSFACDNPELDADWVWDVSQQGWEFILTWVGPQSPCFTTTRPKIFYDEGLAYQQGRGEADLAIATAESLGISGDKIIYYDIEGYTESLACRNAVDSFLTGWTARLHEQGFKAGAYGSPCRSFISDWWNNTPLLDDIWIARWLSPAQYRPEVSVFGEICGLTDEMWDGQRRLRQYAGDHPETWGGVYLGSIDSNVLLGEITAITTTNMATDPQNAAANQQLDAQIRDAKLITPESGWILRGNQLLITQDRGATWDQITPEGVEQILGVEFIDPLQGWLVSPSDQGEISIHQTMDGGENWQASILPASSLDVATAYLEFIDGQVGWVTLKMVSGSSFSIGQLFATQDGGRHWEERTVPLGEPVQFSDPMQGWVAGGPADDQYYATADGGYTWQEVSEREYSLAAVAIEIPNLPENVIQASTADQGSAWALTQNSSCWGDKSTVGVVDVPPDVEAFWCSAQTQLWMTGNYGQSWQEITPE